MKMFKESQKLPFVFAKKILELSEKTGCYVSIDQVVTILSILLDQNLLKADDVEQFTKDFFEEESNNNDSVIIDVEILPRQETLKRYGEIDAAMKEFFLKNKKNFT